jgi:hypothetical protein
VPRIFDDKCIGRLADDANWPFHRNRRKYDGRVPDRQRFKARVQEAARVFIAECRVPNKNAVYREIHDFCKAGLKWLRNHGPAEFQSVINLREKLSAATCEWLGRREIGSRDLPPGARHPEDSVPLNVQINIPWLGEFPEPAVSEAPATAIGRDGEVLSRVPRQQSEVILFPTAADLRDADRCDRESQEVRRRDRLCENIMRFCLIGIDNLLSPEARALRRLAGDYRRDHKPKDLQRLLSLCETASPDLLDWLKQKEKRLNKRVFVCEGTSQWDAWVEFKAKEYGIEWKSITTLLDDKGRSHSGWWFPALIPQPDILDLRDEARHDRACKDIEDIIGSERLILYAPPASPHLRKNDPEVNFVDALRSAWLEATGEAASRTANPDRPGPFIRLVGRCLMLVKEERCAENDVSLVTKYQRRACKFIDEIDMRRRIVERRVETTNRRMANRFCPKSHGSVG